MTEAGQPIPDGTLPSAAGERNPQDTMRHVIGRLRLELVYGQYGLLENPFSVTPNPRYLYESRTHAEARSSLVAGIECGVGFQALIAPPGMGKTTILLSLLELYKDTARTGFLFQIQGDSRDFLRYLLLDLGCATGDSDFVRMQDALNQLLIREHRAGRRSIIVIDEAQTLDVSVLETLRLLSNFETPSEKLVQIILAGQPALAERLTTPEVAQLYQRISIRVKLIPFGLEDTRNYIEHRLRIAGYQRPLLFTHEAVSLIWECSRGIPREINTLCFNSLLLARAMEQKQVDSDILREVVADLDLNPVRFNTDPPASGTRDLQSTNQVLGDVTAADPSSTSTDKVFEAAVAGAGVESDAVGVHSARSDPARHRKADEMASAGSRAAGLPSCEAKVAGNSAEVTHLTPQALEAPAANGAAPSVRSKPFILTSAWIVAIVALVTTGSSLMHHHNGRDHNARTRFKTPQQQRRRIDSTIGLIPTESSARETATGGGPVSRTVVENSCEKLQNVGKIPTIANNATPVFGAVRSIGVPGVTNQAGHIANIVSARLIHQVNPVYPPAAVEAGIQGRVVLRVLVDKHGAVRDVRLISGSPDLAPAAIDAVNRWQYRPSYVNGQPLEWEWLVTVKFKLR